MTGQETTLRGLSIEVLNRTGLDYWSAHNALKDELQRATLGTLRMSDRRLYHAGLKLIRRVEQVERERRWSSQTLSQHIETLVDDARIELSEAVGMTEPEGL